MVPRTLATARWSRWRGRGGGGWQSVLLSDRLTPLCTSQQTLPHFVVQRSLYEVRERPSKTYGWQYFMLAQIIIEIFYNSLMSVLIWACIYYPVGLYRNAEPTNAVHERGALFWLFTWQFMLFSGTFADLVVAAIE